MKGTIPSWRELVTYPQYVSPRAGQTLDTLFELLPIPETHDRFVAMADWLHLAVERGLLKRAEAMSLRDDLGPHM